jgi:hypothetical protein
VKYDLDGCLPDAYATERVGYLDKIILHRIIFFSLIDKHHVRNSEPDQTTMLSWATLSEASKR